VIIKTVTVVGVTGTMGANVAGIFASFGNARVYCIGRDIEKVKKTIPRIVKSVRADAIAKNLIPADFSMLPQCVAESDLVFESSKEDIEVKKEIATMVGKTLPPHAVSGTGSSGLSITEIASCYPEELRGHFFGIHMFNPPYTLPLCELTPTIYTDKEMQAELKEYLKNTLHRTVVEVKDSPAFLGNRIGFQFINEALQYAEKYKDNGGIDYIDALLGSFTGRTMAPLTTSDFVGLDVHKAIVDNIYENTHDYAHETFVLPEFASRLVAEGKLGRKSGGGLYQRIKYENGLIRQTVYDINTGLYRDIIPYVFPFADKMKRRIAEGDYVKAFERLVNNHSQEAEICLSFLLKYIVYSLYATEEVGYTIEAADDVMATGFNWCPPLAMYQALSTVATVPLLIKERLPEICGKVDVDRLLADVKPSKYDYRLYFKSGRKIG
jgi:3-hydroxyacyl-CoA dehydrogenase